MLKQEEIKIRFEKVFPKKQAVVLTDVFVDYQDDLVKSRDFNELKGIVKELAEAQRGSEKRLTRLEAAVEGLAKAQKQTEKELLLFHRSFDSKIGGLGARWGIMAESSFRDAIEGILSEVGFKTEKFIVKDEEGMVFGYPEVVDLDVVIQNGKVFVIEIKSSMSRAEVYIYEKKVDFYKKRTGRDVHRKIIVSPYVEPLAIDIAKRLGIEVFTDINEIK